MPPSIDQFLDLATLQYDGADHADRRTQARAIVEAEPALAEDIAVAAVLGRSRTVATLLAAAPSLAKRPQGPRRRSPLFYLAYGRVLAPREGESAAEAARLLLAAGADPDEHEWWGGQYRFTVLTGVLGEGESGPARQPAHPEWEALMALLLGAGARPDEGQGLYNRMFTGRLDHLPPLLARGLGPQTPANWRICEGVEETDSRSILSMLLAWDVEHGNAARAALLLAAGATLPEPTTGEPSPWRKALLHGHREICALLEAHRLGPEPIGPAERLVAALLSANEHVARALLAEAPALLDDAVRLQPSLLTLAAMRPGTAALSLALTLGLSPDQRDGRGATALHAVAAAGRIDAIEGLLAAGADPRLVDAQHQATAAGWAAWHGQAEAADRLRRGE